MSAIWSGAAGSVLALCFVLVLMLGLAWLAPRTLRRFGQPIGGGAGELRVLRSITIGPRERLVVVRHGDAELLIGVSAGNIALLERRVVEPPGD